MISKPASDYRLDVAVDLKQWDCAKLGKDEAIKVLTGRPKLKGAFVVRASTGPHLAIMVNLGSAKTYQRRIVKSAAGLSLQGATNNFESLDALINYYCEPRAGSGLPTPLLLTQAERAALVLEPTVAASEGSFGFGFEDAAAPSAQDHGYENQETIDRIRTNPTPSWMTKMTRQEATTSLTGKPEGSFVVRPSAKATSGLCVTCVVSRKIKNFIVNKDLLGFSFTDGAVFPTTAALIEAAMAGSTKGMPVQLCEPAHLRTLDNVADAAEGFGFDAEETASSADTVTAVSGKADPAELGGFNEPEPTPQPDIDPAVAKSMSQLMKYYNKHAPGTMAEERLMPIAKRCASAGTGWLSAPLKRKYGVSFDEFLAASSELEFAGFDDSAPDTLEPQPKPEHLLAEIEHTDTVAAAAAAEAEAAKLSKYNAAIGAPEDTAARVAEEARLAEEEAAAAIVAAASSTLNNEIDAADGFGLDVEETTSGAATATVLVASGKDTPLERLLAELGLLGTLVELADEGIDSVKTLRLYSIAELVEAGISETNAKRLFVASGSRSAQGAEAPARKVEADRQEGAAVFGGFDEHAPEPEPEAELAAETDVTDPTGVLASQDGVADAADEQRLEAEADTVGAADVQAAAESAHVVVEERRATVATATSVAEE